MHEPEFYNYTPFRSELLPLLDKTGAECRVAITKGSFALAQQTDLSLRDEQRPIRYGDEMWDKPEVPDIRLPGDLCAFKPGTDFVVVGQAWSPLGRPVRSIDVDIQVANRKKRLRAFGPRSWYKVLGSLTVSEPGLAASVALRWGNAYGGIDLSDPERPLEEPQNPVGNGITRDSGRLVDTPAFQIEEPSRGRFQPAGCAAIGRSFEPRRTYAGTYDAAWLQARYPARPADYRDEHENCAPADQVFGKPLTGGEEVRLSNVSPDGSFSFRVPRLKLEVEAVIDGRSQRINPHLDTLLVDVDAKAVELIWRAAFRCPPKMRKHFEVVCVRHKEFL